MKTLLRIDASSRTSGSHSRQLADYIEKLWHLQNPDGKVINRDLVQTPIPHIHQQTIQGFYTTKEHMTTTLSQATQLSDELIAEVKQANELLISSPLYNLSLPSNLKAYIDQITRKGYTFDKESDGAHIGLLAGKTAYLALVKGGSYKGTPYEALDFQAPYLKAILQYMGIEIKQVFSLEGTINPSLLRENLSLLQEQINQFFNQKAPIYEH